MGGGGLGALKTVLESNTVSLKSKLTVSTQSSKLDSHASKRRDV